jgi:hypothetical protein
LYEDLSQKKNKKMKKMKKKNEKGKEKMDVTRICCFLELKRL